MEKLTSLTDPEKSAVWATFRDTPMKELVQQGDDRLKAFLSLSPEQVSALKDAALEAAFVEGSVNFLYLHLLLVQPADQPLSDLIDQVNAARWESKSLVQQLVAHLAVLSVTETPAPLDTFQLMENDLPLFSFKVDKLRRFSFPELAEKFARGMLVYRAFRSLDFDAFVHAVAHRDDLAVISLLLTVLSADELVALALQQQKGQVAFTVALLWRLVNPFATDEDLESAPAIGALLTQLQRDYPAAYGPVITYFKDHARFLSGFAKHLDSLDTLLDLRQAVAFIPIGTTFSPKSTAALVTTAYYALNPKNKALFWSAVFSIWEGWCCRQIEDPNTHLHQLPVSSFETAVSDHFLTTLTPDAAVQCANLHLAALRLIDVLFFESKAHQDKTIQVHFAHMHFIASTLPTPLPLNSSCRALANGLLADPIWMTRHLRPHPNHKVLEELLYRFMK